MKKFSVIIPVLNEEINLPQLLSSLTKQTEKDFEVVVSDGHSEDKTKAEALKFQDRIDLKFVESPIRNVPGQRNFGAKQATGEYLVFLDSDYKAEDKFLETVASDIEKSGPEIIVPISMPVTKYRF